MKNPERPTLGFIGAGRVGQTLARLLHQRGYTISAIWNRHPESVALLALQLQTQAMPAPSEVLQQAALTFLTVSDDAISGLAASLAGVDLAGRAIVHTSGSLDSTVLSALTTCGARVGSLHPAYPFADVDSAMLGLPGATFALEASDDLLREDLRQIVADLAGHVIEIQSGQKALYHAALVFASNYGVTLYTLADQILRDLGASPEASRPALDRLLAGTLDNLRTRNPAEALTGPLVRGDRQTVAVHLHTLQGYHPALYDLYRQLALLTLPLVEARGIEVAPLRQLLQEDHHDTLDHS